MASLRAFPHRHVSQQDLNAALNGRNEKFQPLMEYGEILLFEAGLQLDGDLDIWSATCENTCVVVDGTLRVSGDISVGEMCALIVTGDVHAKCFSSGDSEVHMNRLVVENVAFVEAYSGGTIRIDQIVADSIIIDSDFQFGTHCRLDARNIIRCSDLSKLRPPWSRKDALAIFHAIRKGIDVVLAD